MHKALAVGIISSALIVPALAIALEEYWVVQDATSTAPSSPKSRWRKTRSLVPSRHEPRRKVQ
jgi:hypothetical protein